MTVPPPRTFSFKHDQIPVPPHTRKEGEAGDGKNDEDEVPKLRRERRCADFLEGKNPFAEEVKQCDSTLTPTMQGTAASAPSYSPQKKPYVPSPDIMLRAKKHPIASLLSKAFTSQTLETCSPLKAGLVRGPSWSETRSQQPIAVRDSQQCDHSVLRQSEGGELVNNDHDWPTIKASSRSASQCCAIELSNAPQAHCQCLVF